jgi:Tol biopolymer transport system component
MQDLATSQEQVWEEPHTHPNGWSPDGLSIAGTQHAAGGGLQVVICRVADAACTPITQGSAPKWSPQGDRLYFVRPAGPGGSYALWSIAIDGSDERRIADPAFRPIDVPSTSEDRADRGRRSRLVPQL